MIRVIGSDASFRRGILGLVVAIFRQAGILDPWIAASGRESQVELALAMTQQDHATGITGADSHRRGNVGPTEFVGPDGYRSISVPVTRR